MSSETSANYSDSENTCVVCFKNVEIYSIGVCDHPVCFECSTRMRVLCRQNECPICRQDLPKVIFTKNIELFNILKIEVERLNFQDRKFGVHFCTGSIQSAYYQLLQHDCPICIEHQRWPFKTFQQLKDHMRKEHELYYCDLCVANLKIFTFERKCYNRSELAQHRRKGDTDNTSHKGHPLCEFCDQRYMDNDELYRHLRRDHLYCHFCDADGKHQYYNSYDDLRNHYRDEHYLCEEGDCKNEPFTSSFRTDIDLKAHNASVHSRHLSRSANKQARTLELEFTLAPRSRPDQNRGNRRLYERRNNEREEEGAIGYDNYYMEPGGTNESRENENAKKLNSLKPENFPSLGNGVQIPNTTSSVTFTSKFTPTSFSGEDFPTLGNSNGRSAVTITGTLNAFHGKDFSNLNTNRTRSPEVTITRTTRGHQRKLEDFPALGDNSGPGSSTVTFSVNSNSQEHMKRPNLSIEVNHNSNGAVPRFSSNSVQVRPKTSEAFPALCSAPIPQAQWVSQKPKKQETKTIKKVAQPPDLPPNRLSQDFPVLTKLTKNDKSKKSSSVKMNLKQQTNDFKSNSPKDSNQNTTKQKQEKNGNKNVKSNDLINDVKVDKEVYTENKSKNKKKKNKNSNDSNQQYASNFSDVNINDLNINNTPNGIANGLRKRSELKINSLEISEQSTKDGAIGDFPPLGKNKPPPGIHVKPPPGFQNFNAITKRQSSSANINLKTVSPNDLTFTNSSGQCYSILPSKQYHHPPNISTRNKNLMENFKIVLNSNESIQEFKNFSDLFRNGSYPSDKYYDHCKSVLGDDFNKIFPELLVLLPDIDKQQELYKIHFEKGEKCNLEVCQTCKQVVTAKDLRNHLANHTLENNFPVLGQPKDAKNVWKK